MRTDFNLGMVETDPKQALSVLYSIAVAMLSQDPSMGPQKHVDVVFANAVFMHMGIRSLILARPDSIVATLRDTNKVVSDNEMKRVIEEEMTPKMRKIIAIVSSVARESKRNAEKRSPN